VRQTRWAKQLPFNPLSPKQVLAYLQLKNYKIPKDRKTRKPTTNDDALRMILRNVQDPLIEDVLEGRALSKALGYLKDTAVGRDGKFHPIYTFRPETGRLSSVRPNLQNVPNGGVDEELAKAIRSCVVPSRPGRVLVECDWRAMEAVLTGWFAGDEEYIAASKKDSHAWFAGYLLLDEGKLKDVPSPKEETFMDFAHWIKKEYKHTRALAKMINLATGYNMRWPLLASTLHCTAEKAKRYIALKATMAPKIEAWKLATWREAHSKGYLETPFGYCVAPETPILTADLRWVPAEFLRPGDELLALEENPNKKRSRQYKLGRVVATKLIQTERVRVKLSDGSSVVTTPEHPWLVDSPRGGYRKWKASNKLRPGQRVLKAMSIWEENLSFNAGWLAGFFDGEGSWSRQVGKRGGASHLTAAQLPGKVMNFAAELATSLGFSVQIEEREDKCATLRVLGGLAEQARFVGTVRPRRLLEKVYKTCVGEVQSQYTVCVVEVESLGIGPIIQMQTSTSTYFAAGFAAHNCNYFWDVLVPDKAKPGNFLLGKEANAALAFRPQGSGAAMLREVMLALEPYDGNLFDFLVPIHDAMLMECEEADAEKVGKVITTQMAIPWPELNNLVIEASVKIGTNWGEMEEED
jgi:hypothetical protein